MKKIQGKTAQLTLAAVLLAVFVILHILIPGGEKMVQGLLMVLTFLPVTIYAMCCGTKKALLMAAAGALLCALLLPPEVLLSYAIPALLIGIVGGLCYGKCKRLTVILIFSFLQLLQNVIEVYIYYVLSGVNFMDSYLTAVDLVYKRIPAQWLTSPMFSQFVDDMMICGVPCLAIIGAGAKGMVSFLLIKMLNSRLVSVMGPEADPQFTQQTKFDGIGISVAYFCAICICVAVAVLPFLGIVPYHFISAAAAAMSILIAIIYVYYFYSIRVRTQTEHQKRLIYSFALVALLPVNIFALPLLEIYLLKKEKDHPDVPNE